MYNYQIFFLVMRTFKIYSLNNFQICNTVLLTSLYMCAQACPTPCDPHGL